MNASEERTHGQQGSHHSSQGAFDHERSLNKQGGRTHQTHDGGFAFTAHRRQADCRRNQQNRGDDHDRSQAQGQEFRLVDDLEQGFQHLALILNG